MTRRADAHMHVFEGGFRGSFQGRPGVQIDEAACYQSLAEEHSVEAALTVGFGGEPWCRNNNEHLARIAPGHPWIRPVAYVEPIQPPTIEQLESFKAQGFVGLSMYIFGAQTTAALAQVSDDVWSWLVEQRWLLSVNSSGTDWEAWLPILERHEQLRLVASHLGLPPAAAEPVDPATASDRMSSALALADFPGPVIKVSGFYVLTEPGHAYPHKAAWPYVAAAFERFGAERLLWGSDFSPHLDLLSFPQTFGLLTEMPFLTGDDRERIEGGNLLRLLAAVDRRQ